MNAVIAKPPSAPVEFERVNLIHFFGKPFPGGAYFALAPLREGNQISCAIVHRAKYDSPLPRVLPAILRQVREKFYTGKEFAAMAWIDFEFELDARRRILSAVDSVSFTPDGSLIRTVVDLATLNKWVALTGPAVKLLLKLDGV